jgi:hypothetical protein
MVAGLANVALLIVLAGAPFAWTYYGQKFAWMWCVAVMPLFLVPVVLGLGTGFDSSQPRKLATAVPRRRFHAGVNSTWRLRAQQGAFSIMWCVVFFVVLRTFSPVASPILEIQTFPIRLYSKMAQGWVAPSVDAMQTVLSAQNVVGPTVIWGVGDTSNDRLANFWIYLYPSNRDSELWLWAYGQTAEISSLCALLSTNPERLVITRDSNLRDAIAATCGVADPRVNVLSPKP